jgi:hypothetical protein
MDLFCAFFKCPHFDSPFSARVIVGERDSDPSDLDPVVEAKEKIP